MYHAYNVIKFLTNDPTCIFSDLIDDIKRTVTEYKDGKRNDAMYKFYNSYCMYIMLKSKKSIEFANILMSEGYPYEYHQLMEYYNLPFRYSANPMADKLLLEMMWGIDNLRLDQAIMGLIGNQEYERFNGNQEFLYRMNDFFNAYPLSFEDLGRSQRLGWIDERISYDDQVIINNFMYVLSNPNHPKYNKIVGDYGELMFYKYLEFVNQGHQQIMWVSRDLGDGYGYDFALYDRMKNILDLYEVKTTTKEEYFYDTELNEFESRICNLMADNPNTNYHVIKLLVGSQFKMVDITDKTNTAKDIYNNKEVKLLKKTKENFINRYSIEKN